jgi:hypothetical protein
VLCSDGIEIFPTANDGFVTQTESAAATLSLPASGVAMAYNADGRVWVLLSDGTIDVLPPM